MTIRDVQQQMEANLKRWYPTLLLGDLLEMCNDKVVEEFKEWDESKSWKQDAEEMADVIIALSGYASTLGIDLQAEIEKKLAIVSAREDQAERDKARGIG